MCSCSGMEKNVIQIQRMLQKCRCRRPGRQSAARPGSSRSHVRVTAHWAHIGCICTETNYFTKLQKIKSNNPHVYSIYLEIFVILKCSSLSCEAGVCLCADV